MGESIATQEEVQDTPVAPPARPFWRSDHHLSSSRVIGCAKCDKKGTLRRQGEEYICEKCLGITHKAKPLRKIMCRGCGRILLEDKEGGGVSISSSLTSKHGKMILKCQDCGRQRKLQGGKI